MSKHVVLGADNRATGFYDDDLSAVPSGAVAISDALWAQWIGNTQGLVYVAASRTLAPFVAPVVAPTSAQLTAYARAKSSALLAAGVTINAAPAGAAPVNVHCDGSSVSRGDLLGLAVAAAADPAFTTDWVDNAGTVTPLSAAELLAFWPAVRGWHSAMVKALSDIEAAIAAGAITTTAEIDAYGWPTA
jgi:hypothetical protein